MSALGSLRSMMVPNSAMVIFVFNSTLHAVIPGERSAAKRGKGTQVQPPFRCRPPGSPSPRCRSAGDDSEFLFVRRCVAVWCWAVARRYTLLVQRQKVGV